MDKEVGYEGRMPIREAMANALRARRQAAGLSLEQVARKVGIGRTLVHAVERNVAGDYLDRLEALAAALGARWEIALVPAEVTTERDELVRLVQGVDEELLSGLLAVVRAWPALAQDDTELIAHLCARRAARASGAVVQLDQPEKQTKRMRS